jgi:hypothetical protein
MWSRVAVIALTLRGGLMVLYCGALLYLGYLLESVWAAVGAIIGSAIGGAIRIWWRNRPRQRYVARNQYLGFLRFPDGAPTSVTSRWRFGLATPSEDRLAFQPRWKNSRQDYGDVILLSVTGVTGSMREPSLADAIFRVRPTYWIMELDTDAGKAEIAGPLDQLHKSAAIVCGGNRMA